MVRFTPTLDFQRSRTCARRQVDETKTDYNLSTSCARAQPWVPSVPTAPGIIGNGATAAATAAAASHSNGLPTFSASGALAKTASAMSAPRKDVSLFPVDNFDSFMTGVWGFDILSGPATPTSPLESFFPLPTQRRARLAPTRDFQRVSKCARREGDEMNTDYNLPASGAHAQPWVPSVPTSPGMIGNGATAAAGAAAAASHHGGLPTFSAAVAFSKTAVPVPAPWTDFLSSPIDNLDSFTTGIWGVDVPSAPATPLQHCPAPSAVLSPSRTQEQRTSALGLLFNCPAEVARGRVILGEEIGSGGCGRVLRVTLSHPEHERELAELTGGAKVVVKMLQQDATPFQLQAQKREADVIRSFLGEPFHENVVMFLAISADDTCLCMEELDGSLQKLLDRGAWLRQAPLADRAMLMAGVVHGLQWIHGRGMVHMDLKPANIMVAAYSGRRVKLKITDFGLAGWDGVDEVRGGTRAYLAPESSDGEIMRASMDVWALGIIFFQLLAVHSRAPTDATVLMEHHLEPRGVLIFQIARHNCALLKARYDGLRSEENRVLLAQAREKRRRLYRKFVMMEVKLGRLEETILSRRMFPIQASLVYKQQVVRLISSMLDRNMLMRPSLESLARWCTTEELWNVHTDIVPRPLPHEVHRELTGLNQRPRDPAGEGWWESKVAGACPPWGKGHPAVLPVDPAY